MQWMRSESPSCIHALQRPREEGNTKTVTSRFRDKQKQTTGFAACISWKRDSKQRTRSHILLKLINKWLSFARWAACDMHYLEEDRCDALAGPPRRLQNSSRLTNAASVLHKKWWWLKSTLFYYANNGFILVFLTLHCCFFGSSL